MLENQKKCTKCQEIKSINEFHKNKLKKDGIDIYCKICTRNRVAKHYNDNKEKYIAKNREYAKTDKAKKKRKEWQQSNKEKCCEYTKKYRDLEGNRNKAKKTRAKNIINERYNERIRYEKNRLEIRAKKKAYRLKNINKWRLYDRVKSHERRVRIINNGGNHTVRDIEKLMTSQKKKCIYCRTIIVGNFHIDHIIAVSKNGTNDISNLQLLCPKCNISKSNKDPYDFALSIGRLL